MSMTILVPLDGSKLAEHALPTAVSLVRHHGGRLELAFVHQPIAFDGMPDAPWSAMAQSMQDRYVADKAEQLQSACSGRVGYALLRGDVRAQLCKHVRAVDASMIVMCSHGRLGISRALAGSVADDVIRQSHVPVLLLRPSLDLPTRTPPVEFHRILIPIDDSAQSRQIFGAATALAARVDTRLVLLRVVSSVPLLLDAGLPYAGAIGASFEDMTADIVAEGEREVADAAADLARDSGYEVDPHVILGDHAGSTIVDYARKCGADLVAMTTHGRGVSRLVLGSVLDTVLAGLNLPLLLLHPSELPAP